MLQITDVEVVFRIGSKIGCSVRIAGRLEFWDQLPRHRSDAVSNASRSGRLISPAHQRNPNAPYICTEVHGPHPLDELVCDMFAKDEKDPEGMIVVDIVNELASDRWGDELVFLERLQVGIRRCSTHTDRELRIFS